MRFVNAEEQDRQLLGELRRAGKGCGATINPGDVAWGSALHLESKRLLRREKDSQGDFWWTAT